MTKYKDIKNNKNRNKMSVLVGRKAPSFAAPAVVNGGEIVSDFTLDDYIGV